MRYLCFLVASVLSAAPPAATTTTLITDKANNLPLSDQFSLPATNFRLLPNGDFSFSTANNSAFFRWQKSTGVRTRLLQAGDPMPGVAQSMLWRMGAGLRNNSLGHLAMVNNFSHPGVSEPNAVFVYDGAFRMVAQAGDAVPGASAHVYVAFGIPFINDAGDVAFMAIHNPAGNLSGKGVFLYRAVGPPLKIARSGEPSPLGPNYSNIYNLIGLNSAGQIAFIADVDSVGPALFLYTPGTGVQALVRTGDPTPGVAGNFQLSTSAGLYFLNEAGQVAYASTVANNSSGVFAGIWVADTGTTPRKVMAILDSTGASIGGNYAHSLGIFGFTPAGEVLYSCELANTGQSQALFLKSPAGPTQVVAARGQTAPGAGAQFQRVYPASVNSTGQVAFYAALSGGSNSYGLFLGGGASTPTPVALEGNETPLGGVYGLAGRSGLALQINDAGQVAFHADILGPNQTAIFFWPGSGAPRSIVSSADALPRGANRMLHLGTQDASNSTALFVAGYAGGRMTYFAKPLKSGAGQIRRISGEFDSVPGLGTLSNLGPMLINDAGDIAFSSGNIISNSPGYPSQGILLSRPSGALVKLALTGDILSDGSILSRINNVGARLNDGAQLAFIGSTVIPDGPAVILASPSALRLIAKGGQSCGADVCDSFPVAPIVNSGGGVGFQAQLTGGAVALFRAEPGNPPVLVAKSGIDDPFGELMTPIQPSFRFNDLNQFAFVAGTGATQRILRATTTGMVRIVRSGDPAPGGGMFTAVGSPLLNGAGQVAFSGRVDDPDSRDGVFVGDGVTVSLRLREGQALPGGGFAGPISGSPVLLPSGGVVLSLPNISGTGKGPWAEARLVHAAASGALTQIAATGEKTGGTGSNYGVLVPMSTPLFNNDGEVLFGSILNGGQDGFAYFLWSPGR